MTVTREFRVYGLPGHRQRESFFPSYRYDWSSDEEGTRILEVTNSDKTGTNDYSVVKITRETANQCMREFLGQLSDGVFENSNVGDWEEITPGNELDENGNTFKRQQGFNYYYEIEWGSFMEHGKVLTQYENIVRGVREYFSINHIDDLMDYTDDEGMNSLSELYEELLDRISMDMDTPFIFSDIYTEEISDGKYSTTITFNNGSDFTVETKAWDDAEDVIHHIKAISDKYDSIKDNNIKKSKEKDTDIEL